MSQRLELKDLLPQRNGVIFTIGLLGGFLAAIALSLFVMIARAAEHQDVLRPMNVAAPTQVVDGGGEFVCEVEHEPPGEPQEENWLRGAAGAERERFPAGPGVPSASTTRS